MGEGLGEKGLGEGVMSNLFVCSQAKAREDLLTVPALMVQ